AQATSDTPFNIGEIFNNGASAEEWNQNVDDTEQLYIKEGSIGVVVLGIGAIALILGVKGYYPIEIAGAIVTGSLFLNMLMLTYFMPKYREKMKFFVKKRR
ncbi:TPA: hypothetical protein ACX6SJ_003983, partial [Photobacterium damselae]